MDGYIAKWIGCVYWWRCSSGSRKRLAVTASASNWISTAASSPTTQASCPGSTTTAFYPEPHTNKSWPNCQHAMSLLVYYYNEPLFMHLPAAARCRAAGTGGG